MSLHSSNLESASKTGQTRTSEALDKLKRQILSCDLRPGERLRFDDLRERLDVGISPLREALTRLAGQGLVILEERKGYRVAPVTRKDLLELTMLRAEFESIGIRESIKNGDIAWEGRILASLHELNAAQKLEEDGTIDWEWDELHASFHDSLVSECGSPRLLEYRQNLVDQATRYRRMSIQYRTSPRDPVEEHTEIAQAVLQRKTDDACYLIRRHYQRTADAILAGDELPETP